MNNRARLVKRMERDDTVPRYDRKRDCWRAWVGGIHEEGCLEYVCGEFAKAGLFYPFRTSIDKTEHEHEHTFEGVLASLLETPEHFSVQGFEEYYSKQEIAFLDKVREKLLMLKKADSAVGDRNPMDDSLRMEATV